jgi:peptidoglycan/xylan/chitin deacetylase (PgdA/CDA1 family)
MRAFILCYHKVGPEQEEGRRLNIAPERLYDHAAYFKRRGYRFLKASELAQHWHPKSVCFTFDDAYQCVFDYGLPVLDGLSVPGTLYAVSSLVGALSCWEGETPRPLADWQTLRAAQKSGHEVGNHTRTHVRLAEISESDQLVEVMRADKELRAEGLDVQSFCYPYGSYNRESVSVLKSAGYSVGLALNKRVARSSDERLALPRIVMAFSDTIPALIYKLHIKPLLRRSSSAL